MAYTQTVAMSDVVKYLVWVTDKSGDYVLADKVRETRDHVMFIKKEKEVARYKKSEIKEYKIAE